MNLFQGLLFQQGYVTSLDFFDRHERPRYGAATAASKLAPTLGNHQASRSWFGARRQPPARAGEIVACGGCG